MDIREQVTRQSYYAEFQSFLIYFQLPRMDPVLSNLFTTYLIELKIQMAKWACFFVSSFTEDTLHQLQLEFSSLGFVLKQIWYQNAAFANKII